MVVGPAGSGKSALVSNWLSKVRKKNSHELVYHMVGCSKDSASECWFVAVSSCL